MSTVYDNVHCCYSTAVSLKPAQEDCNAMITRSPALFGMTLPSGYEKLDAWQAARQAPEEAVSIADAAYRRGAALAGDKHIRKLLDRNVIVRDGEVLLSGEDLLRIIAGMRYSRAESAYDHLMRRRDVVRNFGDQKKRIAAHLPEKQSFRPVKKALKDFTRAGLLSRGRINHRYIPTRDAALLLDQLDLNILADA